MDQYKVMQRFKGKAEKIGSGRIGRDPSDKK